MEAYDVIMLAILVGLTLFGAWKGLAWQVAYLASIFVSFFVAVRFRGPVSTLINTDPPWNKFLAMLILYLGTSLVIWLAFRFVKDIIERVKLKEFDHHAGAVLGLLRGVLWCVIITLFAVTLFGEKQKNSILNSRSGRAIAHLLHNSHGIMPDELDQVLDPYLKPLNERISERLNFPDALKMGTERGLFPDRDNEPDRFPPANIFGGQDDATSREFNPFSFGNDGG